MTNIKERPILFSAPMVRAILEGRKTVTRHPVKATKAHADGFMMLDHGKGWRPYNAFGDFASDHEGMEYPIACPYGKLGDRLWVRETCFINDYREASVPEQERADCEIHYRADGIPDFEGEEELIRWRPSIHMPRWASRILLEVTDVRVERLQDITEEQALAEGIKKHSDGGYHVEDGKHFSDSPVESFACLWSSVGGDWDANPWVWCVSFKRIA
ncbi:hypothetical protein [Pseudomonas helleri]|uniref:hypothetical protein n=1 Tax=Pseudomonas helleri TaxID=1608996 RepID=UPI00065337F9|nr:hypothetical protein [Pseudomonas helleri]KMN08899.1 hypothetical protein TU84_15265 [Pseudomonas helleri]